MDAFRYFVLRESVFGQDADFLEESLTARYNSDLDNNLGNLVSRVLAMQQKYFSGEVQPLRVHPLLIDTELRKKFERAEDELGSYMAQLQFHRALESLWSALDDANRYIVQTAPFTLMKLPDEEKLFRVGEILHHMLEVLRTLARLLAPFLPDTASQLRDLLNLTAATAKPDAAWGAYFARGHTVKPPKMLFPRIETEGSQ
jgi:methionyl-tRNA synthetase